MECTPVNVPTLLRKRKRLRSLREVDRLLREESMYTPEWVIETIDELTKEIVKVGLPCLICDSTVIHEVAVVDDTIPHAAVCGRCADNANEETT